MTIPPLSAPPLSVLPRRILFVDDSAEDVAALLAHLRSGGKAWEGERVATPDELRRALERGTWDAVLIEAAFPGVSVAQAHGLLREFDLDLAFIALSRSLVVEEGVSAMQDGAQDFIAKRRLPRLIPALEREIRDAGIRRERRRAEEELRRIRVRLEHLVSATPAVIFSAELHGDHRTDFLSPNLLDEFGLDPAPFLSDPALWRSHIHPEDREALETRLADQIPDGGGTNEYRLRDGLGRWRWVRQSFRVEPAPEGGGHRMVGYFIDVTPEREAQEARRQTERRYRLLFERSSDGIAITTLDGRFLEVNERLAAIMGRATPEEYEGVNASEGYVDPGAREALLAAARQGSVRNFPVRYRTRNNVEVDTLVSAIPWETEEGKLGGLITIIRDITESLRAERELRASEARFRELAEHIEDVFWITDPEGLRFLYVSPAYEKVWGRAVDELYSRPESWREAVHPEDREAVVAALAGRAWGGYEVEYRIERPDGEIRWIRDRAFPILNAESRVERIVGVAEDVTEQMEALEAVAHLRERFQALTEHASDSIFLVNMDGTVRYSSPNAAAFIGMTPEETIDRNPLDFVHPEDRPAVADGLARAMAAPGTEARVLHRVVQPDGAVRHVESVARNLSGHAAVRGIVVNSRDLTELVELEQRLRHSQKMEAVGRLAGGIAHDFNNLLTVIDGRAEFLLEGLPEGSELREDAAEIRGAAGRAANLTRQLLAFGKRQILQPRPVRLDEIVVEMERMLRRLIGEQIELSVKVEEGGGRLRADPGQLEQVILNLVVNARDAMPAGGRIDIQVGTGGRHPKSHVEGVRTGVAYCWLSVTDFGVGIDPSIRDRIFEPFFTTRPDGTGLGLSTVIGIVEQSDGIIEVESEPGRGSTFTLFFPQIN